MKTTKNSELFKTNKAFFSEFYARVVYKQHREMYLLGWELKRDLCFIRQG
jgi:hypothetical protein